MGRQRYTLTRIRHFTLMRLSNASANFQLSISSNKKVLKLESRIIDSEGPQNDTVRKIKAILTLLDTEGEAIL